MAIGIIVNELVMNAVKYAYPDGAGPIHVVLAAQGDDLVLSIADDGVGLNVKVDPRSTGMGQRIVTRDGDQARRRRRTRSGPRRYPDRAALPPRPRAGGKAGQGSGELTPARRANRIPLRPKSL